MECLRPSLAAPPEHFYWTLVHRLKHVIEGGLALAEREHAAFVTADQRLLRALSTRRLDVSIVDLRSL
jgi:hypothetical protein